MSRPLADYVAVTLISDSAFEDDFPFSGHEDFSGDFAELKGHVENRLKFRIGDKTLREAIRALADCGLVRVTDDSYSGTFYKIRSTGFKSFVETAKLELAQAEKEGDALAPVTRPSDYPNASAFLKHGIFEDYHELGDKWFGRTLAGLQASSAELEGSDEDAGSELQRAEIPAADRIVTLTDNQISSLDSVASDLIGSVEAENSIGGDTSLRLRFLGQLRAGRELVKSQTLNAHLLYQTLMNMLAQLIQKYKGHAIGETAKQLWGLLLKYIFTGQ